MIQEQQNPAEAVLLENIDKPNVLFIFPTDVAASRWTDHLLRLKGGGTIAMEKFTAWDTFKQDSIRSRMQNKRSIPSVLRKIFVSLLIKENAESCAAGEAPIFSSLIRPEFAAHAASFAGWLTGILPQLGSWFTRITGMAPALIGEKGSLADETIEKFEGDDRDLYALARRYKEFLDKRGLFEPAWETPPFEDTGKTCFLFFPECLADYSEYKTLLESAPPVKTVNIRGDHVRDLVFNTFFYTNSRSEITEAALYIRALHEHEHIPWDSIVVSIPDTENYEPYVLREFVLRNIPFVQRTGKPLTSYPGGQFFQALADCASRNFSFDSLVNLLSNKHLPWKDAEEIKALVDFGIRNNCISSWTEEEKDGQKEINVWEDAFTMPLGGIDKNVRSFFNDLKTRVRALRGASSFADVRKFYFSFRERFFDMDSCLPQTDLILSRCISELLSLVEIEKSFPDVKAPDPYMFFSEYLKDISYLAQQPASGLTILPYRTAAPAPFDCHVILGASQDNLSAVFSRMGFLPRRKREGLGFADEDASSDFINLHKLNSLGPAAFFCAEKTFSGYAIPHSLLNPELKARPRYGEGEGAAEGSFEPDHFRAEADFLRTLGNAGDAALIHETQKTGFESWLSRRKQSEESGQWKPEPKVLELIRRRYASKPLYPDKFSVSASSLKSYYSCALEWLFEKILNLENVQNKTSLTAKNISGSVYHAVLNYFFTELKNGNALLSDSENGRLPAAYRRLLEAGMTSVFESFPRVPPNERPEMSALTVRLLQAEKKAVQDKLEAFLVVFLNYFSGYLVAGSETLYESEKDSFYLNGRVDCVLEDARNNFETKGTALIVDFKLKYMPKRGECTGEAERGMTNFQLPMYLSLAEAKGGKPVHTALFFDILDAKPQVLFGKIKNGKNGAVTPKKANEQIIRGMSPHSASPPEDQFQHIMNEFQEKTEQYVKEAESGNFTTFYPHFNTCTKCAWHRVCRTAYRIKPEQSLPERSVDHGR